MRKIILILLFTPKFLFSQDQQRTLLVYNVGLGAITSGIGAVINKPKHTDWKKYFIKGLWQGSIGGLVNYSSKKALYLVNKKNEPITPDESSPVGTHCKDYWVVMRLRGFALLDRLAR